MDEIDRQISDLAGGILQAGMVKVRIALDNNKGFLGNIQKRVYKSAAEESVNWHTKKIRNLINEKREKQKLLDKLEGVYWFKKVKRIFSFAVISIGLLFLSRASLKRLSNVFSILNPNWNSFRVQIFFGFLY